MTPRSGLIYIIINKKTGLVLDDPVGERGVVTANRLNEDDTQKAWCSASHQHLPIPLTSSLYHSGCSLGVETAFGHSRMSETASSSALEVSVGKMETQLSQGMATRKCAVGPLSLKTA